MKLSCKVSTYHLVDGIQYLLTTGVEVSICVLNFIALYLYSDIIQILCMS
jgi:hypothetical protein